MDDLLNEFLTETAESIDVVDVELVKLEQDPNNKEVLDNIFRLVHTIKGTCGFLGLPRLESVAHASENVLGKFRDGELKVSEKAVTVILESLDRIKEILNGLEATEEEPEGDDTDLIERLDVIASGGEAIVADDPAPAEDTVDGEIVDVTLGRTLKPGEVTLEELEAAFAAAPGPGEGGDAPSSAGAAEAKGTLFDRMGGEDTVAVAAHKVSTRLEHADGLKSYFASATPDQRKGRVMGLMLALFKDDIDTAEKVAAQLVPAPGLSDAAFTAFIGIVGEALLECKVGKDIVDDAEMTFELVRDAVLAVGKTAVAKAPPSGPKASAASDMGADHHPADGAAAGGDGKRASQSIRVSVDLLEDLMNMVSELVLTRNQLMQITRNMENNELAVPLQRLSQTTTELQENVMKTRMQPIGNAWAKLPRIVRDLTVELDKKIDLKMIGAETELDRQVLELIKDPLTHMVRNSADHGVETPAERLAAGKSETGTIVLNAYHEGGHIIMEIKDDGRGIPVQKLKGKILEKGLATPGALAEMSDNQIQKFIFHPGFSTAEKVTSVSGRGVGMDVVRSNIEKIGGTIDMTSVEGKGTRFMIKIPLTLAIVAGLIVKASEERFAIPQISVLELVRASADGDHRIEKIKDSPVLRLRNRLLPLVYLNDILGFERKKTLGEDGKPIAEDFIVVTQVGPFTFGIVVDQVFDTEEIVVKPVAPILKNIDVYSGNTILGDGSVIMILDPNGIANMVNSIKGDTQGETQEEVNTRMASGPDENESLLLFQAGTKAPKAVPLSLIARLEEIEVSKIERSDGKAMVQYRGGLMPLVLADPAMKLVEQGGQPVLVFSDREFTMGLAVEEILDIVEEKFEVKLASERPGYIGSAIVAGKATEVIDVTYYLGLAFPDWFGATAEKQETNSRGATVLLVDDSDFFRNMLKPVLAAEGYHVTAVTSAKAVMALMEQGRKFDLIVSDIEMPEMNGLTLAGHLKAADSPWKDTPLIALSALASERDVNRGRSVGFDDYVAKFDKATLLRSLSQQLKIRGDAA